MASKLQTRLINHWQSKGYFVINLVKVTPSGLPDLMAIKKDEVIFIESKEEWDKLSVLQTAKIKILKQLGFKVYLNYNLYESKGNENKSEHF
jgi:Holliday junction resolvase